MRDTGDGHFKTCSQCGFVWESRESFLKDPALKMIGYQVHGEDQREGLFLFNHDCHTTLSLRAGHFLDLYQGPMFQARLIGTEACPGQCLRQGDLRPCPEKCECAYVREVIQIILNWPKQPVATRR